MATLRTPVTAADHIRGPAHAPITLLEYGDYECPQCGRAHPIVDQVQSHFRASIRFVYRHFPLTEVHLHSEIAAESAEFAGTANLFWDMHDALFENQDQLSLPTILVLAEALGLSPLAMRDALEVGQFRNKVRADFVSGVRSGVNGTPTFFINGIRHDGPFDFVSLVAAIQIRLAADTTA